MRDFIFIIGPSAVGKTTLAKSLFEHYKGVYIEQNMVPEFAIPKSVKDEGIFEEEICWKNIIEQIKYFHRNKFRNIIALDFDDLRTRDIPVIFKGYNFITLKIISSNNQQIIDQMEKRHKTGTGLYIKNYQANNNTKIRNRPLLPNEFIIDINGKNEKEVLNEAINLIDNADTLLSYQYKKPDKNLFCSWIQSYNLNND